MEGVAKLEKYMPFLFPSVFLHSSKLLLPCGRIQRHERRATSDLRCHGDVAGDRNRPRRRGLAAAVVDDPERGRPGRRPGGLPVDRLHRHLPRRRLPGLVRAVQVRSTPVHVQICSVSVLRCAACFLTCLNLVGLSRPRLGFLVDFLSHAAIVGFMGGAAIVIGLQQLKGLLGLSHLTNNTDVVSVVKAVLSALHDPVGVCFLERPVNN
jgi:hypothetical protein